MNCYYLSKPSMQKHISFSGHCLHAASTNFEDEDVDEEDDDEDHNDNATTDFVASATENDYPKRITFLVNMWLNHVPMSTRYPTDHAAAMAEFRLTSNMVSLSFSLSPPHTHTLTFTCTVLHRWCRTKKDFA